MGHILPQNYLIGCNCLSMALNSCNREAVFTTNQLILGGKTMERFFYWIRKTIRSNKYCSKCCMTCKYFETCKRDIQL